MTNEEKSNQTHAILYQAVEKFESGGFQDLLDIAEAIDEFPQGEEFDFLLVRRMEKMIVNFRFIADMLKEVREGDV